MGRFPANIIHDGSKEVVTEFPMNSGGGHWAKTKVTRYGKFGGSKSEYTGVGAKDGLGSASRFFYCAKANKSERNKGLDRLDKKERINYDGFHTDKEIITNNKNPKNRQPMQNNHPTVKPIKLMSYLCRLITPPGGIILDPFVGSGTTCISAKLEGFKYIGIEREQEYVDIARARVSAWGNDTDDTKETTDLTLF